MFKLKKKINCSVFRRGNGEGKKGQGRVYLMLGRFVNIKNYVD